VPEVRLDAASATPHGRDYDNFPFLQTGMSIVVSCDMCFPHLALEFLDAGNFRPTHRTIGQSLSYLEYLAVVWSDDANIVGDCQVVEVQLKAVGPVRQSSPAPRR